MALKIQLLKDPTLRHPVEIQQAHVGLVLEAFLHHRSEVGAYKNGFYLVTLEEYLRAMREHDIDAFYWLDKKMGEAVEAIPAYSAVIIVPVEFCVPFKGAVN